MKHMVFDTARSFETKLAGRKLVIETGKIAGLANGSCVVRYGDTVVLVTATASAAPRDGIDFFPLSVDFEERIYAVGRIPGSFMRREGRPSEKAILASDIGITPQNDGKVIRLNFPPLTEERRKELIKTVHKYGEEAKVAARNIRRDANDKFKDMKKKSEITEDDLKDAEKEIQNMVDKICKEIDNEVAKKEKELSEI